jgi:hypothetical protein
VTSPSKRIRRDGPPCKCGCGTHTSTPTTEYVRTHRPHPSLTEVFSRFFVPTDGCWIWTGSIRTTGYGEVGIPGERKTIAAHRASWIIHNGPIPDGLMVCHHCDNRRCVRPDHLFIGTAADNARDCVEKGRSNSPHGIRSGNAKLTWDQVQEIRRRHVPGIHPARRTGGSSTELAAEFGVTKQYVWQLSSGKWRNVA